MAVGDQVLIGYDLVIELPGRTARRRRNAVPQINAAAADRPIRAGREKLEPNSGTSAR